MKRYTLILVFVLSLALTSGLLVKASRAYFGQADQEGSGITLHAEGRGNPLISLHDGRALQSSYVAAAETKQAPTLDRAQALALASGDFDEDGVPDLVAGYNNAEAGLLTLHRGNVDAIYSNSPDAKLRKAKGTFSDSAFLSPAIVFDLPQKPDFLGAGDFDADGHLDVVAAARGSAALYLLRGDGKGNFRPPEQINLEGKVTALATGEINRADGLIDIAVGVIGANGFEVLVFESPLGALRGEPETFSLPAEATALAMGQLDDDYAMDLAIASGSDLLIVHGRDRKLSLDEACQAMVPPAVIEVQSFPFAIVSIAVGDFAGGHQADMALLPEDGSVHVIARGEEKKQKPKDNAVWQEISATGVLKSVDTHDRAGLLIAARVSSLPHDDLIVIDRVGHQLHILVHDSEVPGKPDGANTAVSSGPRIAASLGVDGEPMALLAMRLNDDALSDLVVIRSDQLAPTIVQTAPNNTFTVINTNDSGPGSLRQAMLDADASAGADTIDFNIPGTGIHTITPLFPGLLSITGAVTIDATTQPDFSGLPLVELNGTLAAGAFSPGIGVKANNTLVRGLIINRFGGFGIKVDASNTVIEGNFIGTDSTGNNARGNGLGGVMKDLGINTTIGGTVDAARNIISGNGEVGVRLIGAGNIVEGNNIGVGSNDNNPIAIANEGPGVLVGGASNNVIGGTVSGARNIIAGNSVGVYITGNTSNGNLVQSNWIGNFAVIPIPNSVGVLIDSAPNNTIGGTTTQARNVISGNTNDGITVDGSSATGNLVQGNYIGISITGTSFPALGNGGTGVLLIAPDNTIGGTAAASRNVISGNGSTGVFIEVGAAGTFIQSNYIGTNSLGNSSIGNLGNGVFIASSNNTVGGDGSSPILGISNVISGNTLNGVEINGGLGGNLIKGNFIGIDTFGTDDLGNAGHGVLIINSANNTIGGSFDERNIISGNNSIGLVISGSSATGNTVNENLIGTQRNGVDPLGNSVHGILITDSASNNTIGGAGQGNTIAFNGASGVLVNSAAPNSTGNAIRRNSIFANTGLGIDLVPSGVTPNDFNDADSGPNNLQNFPVLTSVLRSGAYVIIQGFLNSAANSVFSIDFYSNEACDGSGNGEGKRWIGSTIVHTDGVGTAIINSTVRNAVPLSQSVTATATEFGNNTSEFSECRTVVISTTMIVDTSGDGADSNLNDLICDDGTGRCSLRAAIEQSNFNSGTNTITFNISGSGQHTIAPTSQLPAITGVAIIDGTTQPGFAGVPIIELNGASAGGTALTISAGNSTVKGLVINRFAGDAIFLSSAGNTVQNNFIGTDVTGNSALGNAAGILISASNNIIGGTATEERNVISGNSFSGIILSGGSANQVLGNLIGTNGVGAAALGNGNNGVVITNSGGNVIGGNTAAARNVLSANTQNGVLIVGSGATGNTISGNSIGSDLNGNADLGNALDGVVMEGAPNNTIGGTSPGARNIISGNGSNGIEINGSGATGNQVQGNFIGTKANGTEALRNGSNGVFILQLGSNNIIGGTIPGARNIISGNGQSGIRISDSAASGNTMAGNYVGTDVNGAAALGNLQHGVRIEGAGSNIIGGTSSGSGNVISGNNADGIFLNPTAQGAQVQGNLIGTDATGSSDLGNGSNGVDISGAFNSVGGSTTTARNIISGNEGYGVSVNASNNTISGNFIGTKANGIEALRNSGGGVVIGGTFNTVGGTTSVARNVISGNGNGTNGHGVTIIGNSNTISGNFIGTKANGTEALGNDIGVVIIAGSNDIIGGPISGARNIISGNNLMGVVIQGSDNTVQSNFIGCDSTGLAALGNSGAGIFINGSPNNLIGGTGAGNTIAFNGGAGVFAASGIGHAIKGNSIFSNTGLGIDLGTNGVTANDSCDADSGANNLQNFPVLTGAFGSGSNSTIEGSLNSAANTGFTIEFFLNTACDASGFGQGKTFIGSTTVTTDATCNAIFSVTFAFATALGQPITATATDSSNNTSEFSQCVPVTPPSFTVNSTADGGDTNTADGVCNDGTGHCTLRAAIQQANANSDINTIRFNIPGAGVQTITPGSPLPIITGPVTIDGYTQPGSIPNTNPVGQGLNTVLKIELNGINVNNPGLQITAAGSTVRGLVINRCGTGTGHGILSNRGNLIEGNFIGTDATGTVTLGNTNGVALNGGAGSGTTVGGTTPAARNLISGNNGTAVRIGDTQNSASNLVQGNLIGTDVTGTLALRNSGGVTIAGASSTNNTIGGTAAGARNVISASGNGVSISNVGMNIVQGNYLGTDVTGNVALGGNDGVNVENGPGTIIGGATAAARNVISGNNEHGVVISSSGVTVHGNFIGTNAAGTDPLSNSLGNFYAGIVIGGSNNLIGGAGSGEGNIIAHNTVGVIVFSPGVGNAILSNSIFDSVPRGFFDLSGLGIKLQGSGANDLCDSDGGPNNSQNSPVLTSVTSGGGNTTIQGTLNSTANTTFRIEFFSNSSCDPSGRGEGQTFIGFTTLTTDGSCNASFSPSFPVSTAGQVITATATDASNNTSEFSQCFAVCPFSFSPMALFFSAAGGAGSIDITAPSACTWIATTADTWTTFTSLATGAGNGTLTFETSENLTMRARQSIITIAGLAYIVVQDGGLGDDCDFHISPAFQSFSASGGTGSILVITEERCAWQAVSSDSFVIITSTNVGVGIGTVSYSVAPNASATGRNGSISVGGKSFAVKQKGN